MTKYMKRLLMAVYSLGRPHNSLDKELQEKI